MLDHHIVDQGFEHGHFQVLAAAAAFLVHQCRQYGCGHIIGGGLVGDNGRNEARCVRRYRLQIRQARGRLDDIVIGGVIRHGPVAAKTIGGAKNQVGIGGGEFLIFQAELFGHFRPHVVYENVRRTDDLEQRLAPGLLREVKHDTTLVAVRGQVHGRHALVLAWSEVPRGIAGGRLDLDHVGPHVAQHLGGPGAQDNRGQVDNTNAFQCSRHTRLTPRFVAPRPSRCGPVSGAAYPASYHLDPPCPGLGFARTHQSRAGRGPLLLRKA